MAHAAKQEQQKAPAACGKRGAAAKESMEGQHPAQVYMICMMCVCVCVFVCVCTHKNKTTQAADAEGAGVKEAKTKRARGNTSKQSVDASTSAAGEQALSEEEEVARLMEQMRGAESGFYLGCPVEVKLAGAFLSVFFLALVRWG